MTTAKGEACPLCGSAFLVAAPGKVCCYCGWETGSGQHDSSEKKA
jgi:hypothetical protein